MKAVTWNFYNFSHNNSAELTTFKNPFLLYSYTEKEKKTLILKKNKTLAISIAVLLTISMSASIVLIPSTSAHTPPWQIPTYAYIVAAPDPIGVGQAVQIYIWLDPVYGVVGGSSTSSSQPGNGSTASSALLSNQYRFTNYNLTITAPDGHATTQIFATISDPTSSAYTKFTPDQVGTYTLEFSYPGEVYGANGNGYEGSSMFGDVYLPSHVSTTLVVQQDPIAAPIFSYPLPSAWWTRPIYGENTDWYTISSNWFGEGAAGYSTVYQGLNGVSVLPSKFHPDGAGSLTSHIMWTKLIQNGGIVGGIFGTTSMETRTLDPNSNGVGYFEGSAYRQRFMNVIIMDGTLYYNPPIAFNGANSGPLTAVNLRTGEVLWTNPYLQLSGSTFGYIYNLWSPDEHGTFPAILVFAAGRGTQTWSLYDAYTGVTLFNVTGVPSGTAISGPEGEQLRYIINNAGTNANPDWRLERWNSSRLWSYDINPISGRGSGALMVLNNTEATGTIPGSAVISNNPTSIYPQDTIEVNGNIPLNDTTKGLTGTYASWVSTYDWNVSINSWYTNLASSASIVAVHYDDMMLLESGRLPNGFAATGVGGSSAPYTFLAVNLNASKGAIGSLLWTKTYDPPAGNLTMSVGNVDFDNGVFTLTATELANWYGYSLHDGSPLYITPSQAAFDYYGNPKWTVLDGQIAYGKIYSSSLGGILYCYDDVTGDLLWTYGNGGEGNSTSGGFDVSYGRYPTFIQAISNDVVYLISTEHTITDPIYKGAKARAVNATTGEEIWTLSAYSGTFTSESYALADGYNVWFNGYDDSLYTVGRGPSVTTVEAPKAAIDLGRSLVISGTVMDVSAGTKQTQQAGDFPNGVPVASDASMTDWMGYVYQQKPIPTSFTGVEVSLDVVDSNGNFRNIGTAMTDKTGVFNYQWTPDIPGMYTVFATFVGTNGYWPSSAETSFAVDPAAPTPAPTNAPAQSAADMYFVPAIAAIIVLIVIVGVVLALLMVRKRP
jgi:hypothetical protein